MTRPTIVLIHGAFADASGYTGIIARLEADGYPVVAPPNPLRGLTSDADAIRTRVAAIDGPVVLVAHSYGGAVMGAVAAGLTNVIGQVYLAAFALDVGENCLAIQEGYPASLLATENAPTPYDAPGAPGGPDLYIKEERFREVFAGDSSIATARAMFATQRPLSAFAFTQPSGAPAWKTVPSWDLITLDDHAISPGGQQFMAQRAGAQISTVHSAHDVMISHPGRVVGLIEHVAETTS